jgi:hypothetical protein
MKSVAYILILASLTIGAYQLGLHHGQQAGQATATSYQKLYNQAIQWQNHQTANIPTIVPNPKLKEKNHESY